MQNHVARVAFSRYGVAMSLADQRMLAGEIAAGRSRHAPNRSDRAFASETHEVYWPAIGKTIRVAYAPNTGRLITILHNALENTRRHIRSKLHPYREREDCRVDAAPDFDPEELRRFSPEQAPRVTLGDVFREALGVG